MDQHLYDGVELAKQQPIVLVGGDISQNNLAYLQHAQGVGNAMARQQMLSQDTQHIKKQWAMGERHSYPEFPIVMERRGVDRARYEADLNVLHELQAAYDRALYTALCMGCFTSFIIGGCYDPFTTEAKSNTRRYISQMNAYYRAFGELWDCQFTPNIGHFYSFEIAYR